MKQSWLKNHIAEIIALLFFLFAFTTFRIILLREVKADTTTEISIIECIKGALFLILGYYFGSSIGSKNKENTINKLTDTENKKPTD